MSNDRLLQGWRNYRNLEILNGSTGNVKNRKQNLEWTSKISESFIRKLFMEHAALVIIYSNICKYSE